MKKTTQIYSKEISDKWGFTITSEYSGAHSTVTFLCSNGHSNTAVATNLLQRGYKCKECIVGYSVQSKILWNDTQIQKLLVLLETNSTENTAKLLNTTSSAINNKLAELKIPNPRERHTRQNLINKLELQGRVLVTDSGTISAKELVTVKCSKGHVITQQASNIISHNTNCPKCVSLGLSGGEAELTNYIKSIYDGWVELKDRNILEGKELDIVLPDLGLAIEYNGTYWHQEDKVGKYYHQQKTNGVEAFGYQLLHIKDYDWCNKKDIVKSIISSKLGLNNIIGARKCQLKKINFPAQFLNDNHIQGAGQPTSINFGLYYMNTLVAVATFAKPRYDKDADLELVRYCSKLFTNVSGGLSRLLKQVTGRIVSYASRDYSTGVAYSKVGFTLTRITEPGLEYYKRLERVSRYQAQSMTAEELASYVKYYNSGNLVFHRSAH